MVYDSLDIGEGYYDPNTKAQFDYDGKVGE